MAAAADELMSSEEILAAVESTYRRTVEDNAALFRFAYEFATIHNGEALHADRRVLPGTERAVQIGGAGTPKVMEFAAAELGARMQMGTVAAEHFMADALDVWHRLPRIAARVEAGEVKVSYARRVANESRHLSPEAAAKVDADMVLQADGRLPWTRFCTRLAGRIVAADPELAKAREEEARQRTFARASRNSEHGMGTFVLRAPVAWIVRVNATVTFLAEALKAMGDTDGEDLRRAKALLIMANPMQAVELLAAFAERRARSTDEPLPDEPAEPADDSETCSCGGAPALTEPRRFRPGDLPDWLTGLDLWTPKWETLLPRVTLYVHTARETLDAGEGVMRWEGLEPLTLDYFRQHVAPFQHCRITQVIDLAGQEPVDAYEIPDRHREAVHLRTPADCFPFATSTSRDVDIDHNEEYDAARRSTGQSRMDNYGPLGRRHHRVKTHGRWTVRQPFDGIYVWRDPHGHFYLVDHTGTRKLDGTLPTGRPTRFPEVHLYEATEVIELDLGCA
jgi:hypothetical protein